MQTNVFVGNVAAAPKLTGTGENAVCKFTLIETAYAGTDKETGEKRERTTAIQFTAFRKLAEVIMANSRKGDQLAVNYRIENNNYKKEGEDVYSYNFVVEEFAFGAPGKIKRAELEAAQ